MIVAIHQPVYFPYLGFFKKASECDTFIFMDDAQYSKGVFIDYNRIKTPQGEMRLKVPVSARFGDTIMDAEPNQGIPWATKHLKSIAANYGKSKYFDRLYPKVEQVLTGRHENLSCLNMATVLMLFDWFGIRVETATTHEMMIRSKKERRVIDICKFVGADVYMSGTKAREYQNDSSFAEAGIKLRYSEFRPKRYEQRFGEFIPYMSAIDYAMNVGHDLSEAWE